MNTVLFKPTARLSFLPQQTRSTFADAKETCGINSINQLCCSVKMFVTTKTEHGFVAATLLLRSSIVLPSGQSHDPGQGCGLQLQFDFAAAKLLPTSAAVKVKLSLQNLCSCAGSPIRRFLLTFPLSPATWLFSLTGLGQSRRDCVKRLLLRLLLLLSFFFSLS